MTEPGGIGMTGAAGAAGVFGGSISSQQYMSFSSFEDSNYQKHNLLQMFQQAFLHIVLF